MRGKFFRDKLGLLTGCLQVPAAGVFLSPRCCIPSGYWSWNNGFWSSPFGLPHPTPPVWEAQQTILSMPLHSTTLGGYVWRAKYSPSGYTAPGHDSVLWKRLLGLWGFWCSLEFWLVCQCICSSASVGKYLLVGSTLTEMGNQYSRALGPASRIPSSLRKWNAKCRWARYYSSHWSPDRKGQEQEESLVSMFQKVPESDLTMVKSEEAECRTRCPGRELLGAHMHCVGLGMWCRGRPGGWGLAHQTS